MSATTEVASPAREKLLAAAARLFGELGSEGVSLEEVATAAGVHRATLHRQFPGGREELVLAVIEQESRRLATQAIGASRQASSAAEALLEAATAVVMASRESVLMAALLGDAASRHAVLGVAAGNVRSAALTVWDHILVQAALEERTPTPATEREVIEYIFRTVASLVNDPGDIVDEDGVRRYLELFLLPALLPRKGEQYR